jgi:6-phosphogluconolactonase (cycloisomerase 2 family)
MNERVYVQTNDAERNEVAAFDRAGDGRLTPLGKYETGGRGTGVPHLASQSSVVLSDDGAWLLVANAGSDELSLLGVESEGLRLAGRIASGGNGPTSVAERGGLVYALNNGGTPNISGFTIADGGLVLLDSFDADAQRRCRSGPGRLQPRRAHARRDGAWDKQHQRLHGRRARLRSRPGNHPLTAASST